MSFGTTVWDYFWRVKGGREGVWGRDVVGWGPCGVGGQRVCGEPTDGRGVGNAVWQGAKVGVGCVVWGWGGGSEEQRQAVPAMAPRMGSGGVCVCVRWDSHNAAKRGASPQRLTSCPQRCACVAQFLAKP